MNSASRTMSDDGRRPAGISLSNWLWEPYSHWSYQHVEDMVPTAVISRRDTPAVALPPARSPVAEIPVTTTDGTATTVGGVMDGTETDGWAVACRGSLAAEEYRDGMGPQTRHLMFSVSKSLIGVVAGVLHGAGALDTDAEVTTFVPALARSGYAGATVRHLLDMRSGVAFSDDYSDPNADIHILDQAMGWAPRSTPDIPSTLYDFLVTLRQTAPHGGPFEYRSCETDVLGLVCEVIGGQRMPGLMSEVLWSRIGAQTDATIGVDRVGTGMFNGGISGCLTDMIRFGSLFLRDGVSLNDQQVVHEAWIADTLDGGPDSRQAFAATDTGLPGGMYRNQMWFPYPGNNVALCLGMCGQMIYINRAAQTVAAKLSTQPHTHGPHVLLDTLRAFDAAAAELSAYPAWPGAR